MDPQEKLYSLFFEISNKDRYNIIRHLLKKKSNLTQLSNIQDLKLSETRRHLSRLTEVGLVQKNLDGTYQLTNYGVQILGQIDNISFFTENQEYFQSHSIEYIPKQFLSNFDLLKSSHLIDDMLNFMRILNQLISQAKTHAYVILEKIPWVSTPAIIQAINRGVKFRIIEKKKEDNDSYISILDDNRDLPNRIIQSPFVEYATLEKIGSIIITTDNSASLILPMMDGKYDYCGFIALQKAAIKWCNDLFEYYWEKAEKRIIVQEAQLDKDSEEKHIIVEGTENSSVDPFSVQDAIDNNNIVTLIGRFNFGTSSVHIKHNVTIIGDGRDDLGYPSTKIYKHGWIFPFYEPDSIFRIDGDEINVVIDNIHFMDFNCSAIWGDYGNRLEVRNCDFTVKTGHHKGLSSRSYGDILYGIYVQFPYERYLEGKRGSFPGGIIIEDNWMHFAWGGRDQSGYISSGVLEVDPEYRPNLLNHEYYIGMGIVIDMAGGPVNIERNWIWYTNSRGIAVLDCFPTSSVVINENIIRSECFGSYPFNEYLSGIGILAQNGFNFSSDRGCIVEITDNIIEYTKMNYCGIGVFGPNIYEDDLVGDGKLPGGFVKGNRISLSNGHVGILVRGSDDFEIVENEVSGSSYYGIQVLGMKDIGGFNRSARDNLILRNNFNDLALCDSEVYYRNHRDGLMFSNCVGNPLAHIWLNTYSRSNRLLIHPNDYIINSGQDNEITHEEFILPKYKKIEHPKRYL